MFGAKIMINQKLKDQNAVRGKSDQSCSTIATKNILIKNELRCDSPAVTQQEQSAKGEKKTYTVLSQWLGALIVVDRSFMAVSIMEEESFYQEFIDPSPRWNRGGGELRHLHKVFIVDIAVVYATVIPTPEIQLDIS